MALHRFSSVTLGVANVEETAAYDNEFGLTPDVRAVNCAPTTIIAFSRERIPQLLPGGNMVQTISTSRSLRRALATITLAAVATLAVQTPSRAADTIKIGTSLPLSGPLSSFGPIIRLGYQRAVDEANAAGGATIGGEKRQFELIVRDNQSQPPLSAQQSRSLIDENGAVALLGSVTPPLVIPASAVAESKHIPLLTSLTPVEAWAAGSAPGWTYAWDVFFAEHQMTDLQYLASNRVKTNKKVALFTDNEQDGAVMGGLWASKASKFGYTIAYHAIFPVGTTDFDSYIAEAKKAGAEVLIAQMIPPDAFALWKQMKSVGYAPKVAFCEKCGDADVWSKALGSVGDGTMAAGWWSPALGRPQTKAFVDAYEKSLGNTVDLGSVVACYSTARVMIDAIKRAGSTDPAKINAEIGKTDANLPIVHVHFNAKHQSVVPAIMVQWQGDAMPLIYPKVGSATASVIPLGLGH